MAGINVMEEMARRRSSQASQLAPMLPGGSAPPQQQQSMVPPQQAAPAQQAAPQQSQMPPENMAGGMPGSIAELRQLHESQNASMEARGQDLRLAQMLMRALDPGMPKGFRQLGMKNISQTLGVDPRGETSKEIINTITGLDPESLEGLRRGLAAASTDAPPGEISKMLKGTLTGQVPPDQLLDMAAAAVQPQAPAGGGGEVETPPMMLGGPPPGLDIGQESIVTTAQAPGQAPGPGAPLGPRQTGPAQMPGGAAPPSEVPRYQEREVSPRMREVVPELADALGLDMSQPYRVIDVIKGGNRRIPSTAEGMHTMAQDIRTQQAGVVDAVTMSSQLADMVRGRPEALDLIIPLPSVNMGTGPGGFGQVGGDVRVGNLPNFLTQMWGAVRGIGNMTGAGSTPELTERWMRKLDTVSETDPLYSPGLRRATDAVSNSVLDYFRSTGQAVENAAEMNARIRSIMIPLAFAMASAKGQTGRFLSDRDIELQLQEIGRSSNPEQFVATLTDMVGRVYAGYNNRMQTSTGGPVGLSHAFTPEAAEIVRRGGIAPEGLLSQLPVQNVNTAQTPGAPPTATPPAPPAAGEPNAGRFAAPAGRLPGTTPEAAPPPTPTPPVREGRATSPQPGDGRRVLQRHGPTIEQEEEAAQGRAREERAAILEARDHGRRRMAIADSAEGRAQREEVERRRERIRAAFAQIGASLRGSASSGGGGGTPNMGGDQDPAAFKVNPAPKRAPPAPVNAAPYQMQPRRRSGG